MPRAARNIFAPKSGRVLRVLLVDYGRDWNERDFAKVAKVSRGLAHYVCKTLVQLGYVARNEKHRQAFASPTAQGPSAVVRFTASEDLRIDSRQRIKAFLENLAF